METTAQRRERLGLPALTPQQVEFWKMYAKNGPEAMIGYGLSKEPMHGYGKPATA